MGGAFDTTLERWHKRCIAAGSTKQARNVPSDSQNVDKKSNDNVGNMAQKNLA
tara:strand:+ start:3161 stop:3319 length:159 start_codon:yes stop_codon:yes gene_type:complete